MEKIQKRLRFKTFSAGSWMSQAATSIICLGLGFLLVFISLQASERAGRVRKSWKRRRNKEANTHKVVKSNICKLIISVISITVITSCHVSDRFTFYFQVRLKSFQSKVNMIVIVVSNTIKCFCCFCQKRKEKSK